jgi:alanine racemase
MIDVTGIAGVSVGDEVVLFGEGQDQAIGVDEVAEKSGKISYELLCAVGRRVPRVYTRGGRIVKTSNYLE